MNALQVANGLHDALHGKLISEQLVIARSYVDKFHACEAPPMGWAFWASRALPHLNIAPEVVDQLVQSL